MYDTVTGKFYVNKGSGTFEKGEDVEGRLISSLTEVTTNANHTLYAI